MMMSPLALALFMAFTVVSVVQSDEAITRFEDAIKERDQASATAIGLNVIAADEEKYGSESEEVGVKLNFIALNLFSIGEVESSRIFLERALAIFEKREGSRGANVGAACNNLADIYLKIDEVEMAKALYERAIRIKREKFPKSSTLAYSLRGLGLAFESSNNLAEAIRLHREAVDICIESLGRTNSETAMAQFVLAKALRKFGLIEESDELFLDLIAVLIVESGDSDPNTETAVNEYLMFRAEQNLATSREDLLDEFYKRAQVLYKKPEPNFSPAERAILKQIDALSNSAEYAEVVSKTRALVSLAKANHGIGSDPFGLAVWIDESSRLRNEQERFPGLRQLLERESNFAANGDFSNAIIALNECLQTVEANSGLNSIVEVDLRGGLGRQLFVAGDFRKAIEQTCSAIEISKSISPEFSPQLSQLHIQLGFFLLQVGEAEDGMSSLRIGRNVQKMAPPGRNLEDAKFLHNLGSYYLSHGDAIEASKALYKSMVLHSSPTVMNSYAMALMQRGELDRAEGILKLAIEIDEKSLPKIHPDHTRNFNNLGALYQKKGMHGDAIGLFDKAIQQDLALGLSAHPNHAIHLDNAAESLAAVGRFEEAIAFLKTAVSIDRDSLGRDHRQTMRHEKNLEEIIAKSKL